MPEVFQTFFGSGPFVPHGHCYLWHTPLVWLHALSDSLVALAYYSIPIFLIALLHKRQDLPFRPLFWLFGGFIISCGTTHWMEVATLWYPAYWLSGTIKAITALLSVWTALELISLFPQAVALPNIEQYEMANWALQQAISQQKQVEGALRESQLRYSTLAEAVPVGIFRFDLSGNCIYINDYGCQMIGRPAASAMGAGWLQTIHPEDRERVLKEWSDWMASPEREQFYKIEARIQQPDGTIVWYYTQGMAELDANGTPCGFVGSLTDITERQQIEQDLRRSEARLKEAQEVAHIGSWEYDITTGNIFWSDEIFRIFGLTPGQQEPDYESHLAQNFPPEDGQRLNECVMRALGEGEPYELDLQSIRADGSQGWVFAKGQPILNEQNQVVRLVGVALDITERKVIEAQQQQLSQMKDDFLSTVSHELRSPLASIKMAVHLLELNLNRMTAPLEAKAEAQPHRLQQYLGILREQCDQELELVNNLLDLQRLEAEGIQAEIAPIEISEWVPQVIRTFEARMQERQQHLQVLLPNVLIPFCSDIGILSSVLRELLTNACKYTPPGETITVEVCPDQEHLQLRVSNSGVQIAQEELERIFDKFYRISKTDRWRQGGTGLGLALIKKQVEYLGGRMWAESDDLGVHFILRLPLDNAM